MLAGGPLSFASSLQKLTPQSTAEAELIYLACCAKEAVYLHNMIKELGIHKFKCVGISQADNTGALYIGDKSRACSTRAKHISLSGLTIYVSWSNTARSVFITFRKTSDSSWQTFHQTCQPCNKNVQYTDWSA